MITSSSVQLEVCIASVDDAIAACAGGANRLELNVGLELGGLTPSVGLLEEVKQAVAVPVVAMVRPRGAGFCYSRRERLVIMRDAESLLSAGADGIVSGALQSDGTIDLDFWQPLREVVLNRELVFHRAFDLISDQVTELQRLINSGTHRVLTSGGCQTAWEGREQIQRLRLFAEGQIEILAGAGVSPVNAAQLIDATGCNQLHGSFRKILHDSAGHVADEDYPATDQKLVAATRAALDR